MVHLLNQERKLAGGCRPEGDEIVERTRAPGSGVIPEDTAGALIAQWRRRGRELGFGAGIAQGYATLGQIGFAERSGYTAIGTVCNLAARLCAEANDGQILIAQRVAVDQAITLEEIGS